MKDYRLLIRLEKDLEKLHEEICKSNNLKESFWGSLNKEQKYKLGDVLYFMEKIPLHLETNESL